MAGGSTVLFRAVVRRPVMRLSRLLVPHVELYGDLTAAQTNQRRCRYHRSRSPVGGSFARHDLASPFPGTIVLGPTPEVNAQQVNIPVLQPDGHRVLAESRKI